MALQVRHSRSCPVCPERTEAAAKAEPRACGCEMAWYDVRRIDGKLERRLLGHDAATAEKELGRIEVHIDEGRYQPPRAVRFDAFADEWLEGLRRRPTTAANYGVTLGIAKRAFGRKYVSKLGVSDVRKMLGLIEEEYRERQTKRAPKKTPREVSPATKNKHLRQLATCLEAAVADGLLGSNPCKRLPKSQRPKAAKRSPSYFTNDDLTRLWPELASRPTWLAAFKLLATTGMRFGELAGLRWADVRLLEGELHIRRQYTAGEEVDTTKGGKPRIVHLVPAARSVLEAWWNETGDAGLVFESELGGNLDGSGARAMLARAMKRAGIPEIGEGGGKRTVHSLRHTFARIALENGAPIQWVKDELGHSTIVLTVDLYGSWSQEASKVAAERLEGAFAV